MPTRRGTLYCRFLFHACALYRNELFLRRFFIFLFPVFPADLDHQSGQGQQCDQVRDYHEAIEEVRKVPDQFHFLQRTEQHTEDNADAVYRQRLLAEEGLEVDLAEEVPADDVEKAKNSMHMAMKTSPNQPNFWLKASWARAAPVAPLPRTQEVRITIAVRVRITKVSMKTLTMAISPCSWGCFTLARAWA